MAEQFVNPFDSDNFREGGGLWDGKVVTITKSKTETKRLAYKDGSAVVNDNGEQAVRNVWTISGIAEDTEKEITREYSIGGMIPTADGEGFTRQDGKPAILHKNSDAAKLAAALKTSGFDVNLLFVNGKPKVSALEGAKLRFKGEDRLDKDGKPKKQKNNPKYTEQDFFPVEFVGFSATARKGNGVDDATKAKATDAVMGVLAEAGGTLTQVDLVKALSRKMAGSADLPAIVGLVSKREVPGVKVEGATFSL